MCIELCNSYNLREIQKFLTISSHHTSPAPCRGTTYQSRCRGCRWHIERLCAWNHRCSHGCHICLNSPPGFGGSGPPASQSSWLTGPPRPPLHWRPSRSHRTPGFEEIADSDSIIPFRFRSNTFPRLAAQDGFVKRGRSGGVGEVKDLCRLCRFFSGLSINFNMLHRKEINTMCLWLTDNISRAKLWMKFFFVYLKNLWNNLLLDVSFSLRISLNSLKKTLGTV